MGHLRDIIFLAWWGIVLGYIIQIAYPTKRQARAFYRRSITYSVYSDEMFPI